MPSKAVVYWDTCVFLDWMKPDQHKERIALIAPLVQLAQEEKLLIVTSSWTLVELTRTEDGVLRTEQDEKKLVDFLKNDFIEIRTLTRAVAEKSRELQRLSVNRGLKMPKADSIHLATALVNKQTIEIHTFDDKDLKPHDKKWGDPVRHIGHPCLPGHLINPPSDIQPPLFPPRS